MSPFVRLARASVLCLGVVAAFAPSRASAQRIAYPAPGVTVNIDVFYDALTPYGDWQVVPPYGWVWVPWGMTTGWRPYTTGHWVFTDFGWTWVDDFDWGWACYHYGRWAFMPGWGWAWVPGGIWAPAWVVWRMGGGWIGWAPMAPEVGWHVGMGATFGGEPAERGVASFGWSFVAERDMAEPRVAARLVPAERTRVLVQQTTNVTRYNVVGGSVINASVPVEHVERAMGRPITVRRVLDSPRPVAHPDERITEDAVRVYRPATIAPGASAAPAHRIMRGPAEREPEVRQTPRSMPAAQPTPSPAARSQPQAAPAPAPARKESTEQRPAVREAPRPQPPPARPTRAEKEDREEQQRGRPAPRGRGPERREK